MYSCIIFDMDGTVTDSYEGIFNAYRYAFGRLGEEFRGRDFVDRVVGAPLLYVFQNICLMEHDRALDAVRHYREYYSERGRHEVKPYAGIDTALKKLKTSGTFIGMATLKRETFAKEILVELKLSEYFDAVCGMDECDTLTKSQLILRCVSEAGVSSSETLLVGDSEFDALGAADAGVDFMAVTYGFGFKEPDVFSKLNVKFKADSPLDIARELLGKNAV